MNTNLTISLWGKDIAVVLWDREKQCAVIEFLSSFVPQNLDIAPLMMPLGDMQRGNRIFTFPLQQGKTFQGLPGMLADSLPDDYGNTIIDEWVARKGLSSRDLNPIDRLCYIGQRGMGALEYSPATGDKALDESSHIEIAQLTELAQMVLNERQTFQSDLLQHDKAILDILKVGTSAGGAKPKAIIAFNEDTREVRSGQVQAPEGFSYWLLKFDGVENRKLNDNPMGIGSIEYIYSKMAVAAGIEMTECQLMREGDYAHFMTKRFDRTEKGEKIHTQTFCSIAHVDRNERHSYEQLFEVMRQLHLPYTSMVELYRRMVFNVVARNHDDHTKNHSFVMNPNGEWHLSPAYDLCYSYSPSGRWTSTHQLSLNNKRDNFSYADLQAVAQAMSIQHSTLIIEQVVDSVAQWHRLAKEEGVSSEQIKQIGDNLLLLRP